MQQKGRPENGYMLIANRYFEAWPIHYIIFSSDHAMEIDTMMKATLIGGQEDGKTIAITRESNSLYFLESPDNFDNFLGFRHETDAHMVTLKQLEYRLVFICPRTRRHIFEFAGKS